MSTLVGLPVILNGQVISRVEQPVLTNDGRRLRGMVVRHGLRSARWVTTEQMETVGNVSIIVNDRPGRMPPCADFALRSVRDTTGMTLGVVTDVWLNPRTLRVEALEILLGLVEALRCGPLRCERFSVCSSGEDAGLVLLPQNAWLEQQNVATYSAGRR